jgi:hypothetical protein
MTTDWEPAGPEVMIGRHSIQAETTPGAKSTLLRIAVFDLVCSTVFLSSDKMLIDF